MYSFQMSPRLRELSFVELNFLEWFVFALAQGPGLEYLDSLLIVTFCESESPSQAFWKALLI